MDMADSKNTASASDQQVSPHSSNNRDGAEANGENLELQELDVPRLQDLATDALSASNVAPPGRESSANVRTRRAVHPQQQPQPQPASVQSAANQQLPQAHVNVNFVAHWFPQRADRDSKFGCHVILHKK